MNVFQEIGGAIAGVKAYPRFLKNKGGKVFGYGVLVVTIFFLVANIRGVIGASIFVGGLADEIRENVPDFELEDGVLYMDEPFYYEEGNNVASFDNDYIVFEYTESEWKQRLIDYDNVFIGDPEGLVMKNKGEIQILEWPADWDFERDDIIGYLPLLSVGIFIFYIFYYIFAIGGYFFAALFVALVGMIAASTQGYKFTFGQIYLLSIYGKTLALFIKALCRLTGLTSFPFMGTLIGMAGFVISCVYVCLAMGQITRQRKEEEQMNMMGGSPIIY